MVSREGGEGSEGGNAFSFSSHPSRSSRDIFLLGFLESVPEVSARLKEVNVKERKFEEVVKAAEAAAVLVLVY